MANYKEALQGNNVDLQSILDTINAMEGGSEVDSTFVPTDSGGTSYKYKLADNNIDLQKILEMAESLPEAPTITLISFTVNGTSYYAEEGMTWAEYIEKDIADGAYDDFMPDRSRGYVMSAFDGMLLMLNGKYVLTTDIIQSNAVYDKSYGEDL